jgi:hypothetical protein
MYLKNWVKSPHAEKDAQTSKDPDITGRGLAAHNKTKNKIAATVRDLSWFPMSPKSCEPEYDPAWKTNGAFFVCEVKSITAKN